MIRTYQAIDSVTGGLYTWQAAAVDHLGTGYPGPNSPTHVLQISPEYWHGDPGPGGAAYAAQWHDLVNTDFTAQPDQTFSADGDVTVDGLVWTVRNYAGRIATSTFTIKNGATYGLKLPSTTTALNGSTPAGQGSTPELFHKLVNNPLFANLTKQTPLRCVARLNRISTVNETHEIGFCLAIRNPSASLASGTFINGRTAYGVNESLGNLTSARYFMGQAAGGFTGVTGQSGGNRYLGLKVDGVGPRTFLALIARSSNDAIANLDNANVYQDSPATTVYSGTADLDPYYLLGNWGFGISSLTNSSTAVAADVTYVSHFRAQAWY
jgi:hypothetical protein